MSRLLRNIFLVIFPGITCLAGVVSGQTVASFVRFKSVEASVPGKNTVQLRWEIAGEIDSGTYFVIERSADAVVFQSLHKTAIAAENAITGYQFTDRYVLTDSAYYRIVLFDRAAQRTVSNVYKVQLSSPPRTEIIIMPNPVFNNAALIINDEYLGDISCILYDMTGKRIRAYQIRKTTAYLQQILDMYSVPKGEYILSIQGASLQESKRILKQ